MVSLETITKLANGELTINDAIGNMVVPSMVEAGEKTKILRIFKDPENEGKHLFELKGYTIDINDFIADMNTKVNNTEAEKEKLRLELVQANYLVKQSADAIKDALEEIEKLSLDKADLERSLSHKNNKPIKKAVKKEPVKAVKKVVKKTTKRK